MIQIMSKAEAEKRGLFTVDPLTGRQIPFTSFRIDLTEEQQKEHQRMLDEGEIAF